MTEGNLIYKDTAHERMFEKSYLDTEAAHSRAQKALTESEIDMDQFTDYDPAVLASDKKEVARLEGLFEQTPSKIFGDILEALICEHGELSDWFGPQAQVIKTTRFDDYINKIDLVVEFERDEQQFSYIALGVDVTFGSRDLHKKFDGIRARIDSGELGEVKYFHSERQHFTGRKKKIPQVVIGVEIERVKELGLLWMNRKNKELGEHQVQTAILEQTALELKTFAAYARRTDKRQAAAIFETELQKVRELLEEKKRLGISGIPDDKVFLEIQRQLSSFGEDA